MEPTSSLDLETASLLLPFRKGRQRVSLREIVRLEGLVNYTCCHFRDGSQLVVALTMKVLLSRLPAGALIRLHQKHAVNPFFVAVWEPRQYRVRLVTGEAIAIARRRSGVMAKERMMKE